jgi:hypothetical protein
MKLLFAAVHESVIGTKRTSAGGFAAMRSAACDPRCAGVLVLSGGEFMALLGGTAVAQLERHGYV